MRPAPPIAAGRIQDGLDFAAGAGEIADAGELAAGVIDMVPGGGEDMGGGTYGITCVDMVCVAGVTSVLVRGGGGGAYTGALGALVLALVRGGGGGAYTVPTA